MPGSRKNQSKKSKTDSYDHSLNSKKKKKQSDEQSKLNEDIKVEKIEIVNKINEYPGIGRQAKKTNKNQAAQKDVNHLIEQLSLGNKNPGIKNRKLKGLKNVREVRGSNGRRIFFREKNGKIKILAIFDKRNQKKVIAILKEFYS